MKYRLVSKKLGMKSKKKHENDGDAFKELRDFRLILEEEIGFHSSAWIAELFKVKKCKK